MERCWHWAALEARLPMSVSIEWIDGTAPALGGLEGKSSHVGLNQLDQGNAASFGRHGSVSLHVVLNRLNRWDATCVLINYIDGTLLSLGALEAGVPTVVPVKGSVRARRDTPFQKPLGVIRASGCQFFTKSRTRPSDMRSSF